MNKGLNSMGQRLKALRKNKDITIKQLSVETGINNGTISLIENDETSPSTDFISKLCTFFKVSADYVLFGDIKNNEQIIDEKINIPENGTILPEEIPQLPIITSLIDIISNDRKIIKDTLDKALETKDEVIKSKDDIIKAHIDARTDLKELQNLLLERMSK